MSAIGSDTSAASTLIPIVINASIAPAIPSIMLMLTAFGCSLYQKLNIVAGKSAKLIPTIEVTTSTMLSKSIATIIASIPIAMVKCWVCFVSACLFFLARKSFDTLVERTNRNVSADDMTAANSRTKPIPSRYPERSCSKPTMSAVVGIMSGKLAFTDSPISTTSIPSKKKSVPVIISDFLATELFFAAYILCQNSAPTKSIIIP